MENQRNDQNRQKPKRDKVDGPKREAILNLQKYQDKKIIVTFLGGRKVTGVLKGFDQLMNLVLDETEESVRDQEDESVLTGETRALGLVVIRGPLLLTISPFDGSEIIDNPFQTSTQEQPVF